MASRIPSPQISMHSEGRERVPLPHFHPFSIRQPASQPSLMRAFPSSHSSGISHKPLPQTAVGKLQASGPPVLVHTAFYSMTHQDEHPSPLKVLLSSHELALSWRSIPSPHKSRHSDGSARLPPKHSQLASISQLASQPLPAAMPLSHSSSGSS